MGAICRMFVSPENSYVEILTLNALRGIRLVLGGRVSLGSDCITRVETS